MRFFLRVLRASILDTVEQNAPTHFTRLTWSDVPPGFE